MIPEAALCSLYDVMPLTSQKDKVLNVRVSPEVRAKFKIACGLRGASMSTAIMQFIYRTIREEETAAPLKFTDAEVAARIAADEAEESTRKGRFKPGERREESVSTRRPGVLPIVELGKKSGRKKQA